jgi:hypothetical protein
MLKKAAKLGLQINACWIPIEVILK